MSYADIKQGNVVVYRSGHISPMLFIGQVVGQPSEKTAQLTYYRESDGTFTIQPTRKDRSGIVGVLRMDMTPEQGATEISYLLDERRAKIAAANQAFEEALLALIEDQSGD